MPSEQKATGNPVFDYKSGFRAFAQSAQRILFFSGLLLIGAGVAGRFVSFANAALNVTLKWSPLLGLGMLALSGVWGFWWRSKLRRDFRREYGK